MTEGTSNTNSDQARLRDPLKQLRSGTIASVVVRSGFILLGFLTSLTLARGMGSHAYGTFAFIYSWIAIFAIPAQLGIPTLVVREVANCNSRRDFDLLRGLILRTGQGVLLSSLLAAAGFLFFVWRWDPILGSTDHTQAFLWGAVLLPMIGLSSLRGSILTGLNNPVRGQLPEHLFRPALSLLFYWACLVFGIGLSPTVVLALTTIGAFLSFVLGSLMLLQVLPKELPSAIPRFENARWLKSVLILSAIGGLQTIISQTDIVMLGMMMTKTEVGIYRLAVQMSSLTSFGLMASAITLAPKIAKAYHDGDFTRMRAMMRWSTKAAVLTALPVLVLFTVFGEEILKTVFGAEYSSGWVPLAILSLGGMFVATTGPMMTLASMTGNESLSAKVGGATAVANILLNSLLIPRYGMAGSAAASTISHVFWKFTLAFLVNRRMALLSTSSSG